MARLMRIVGGRPFHCPRPHHHNQQDHCHCYPPYHRGHPSGREKDMLLFVPYVWIAVVGTSRNAQATPLHLHPLRFRNRQHLMDCC